MVLNRENGAHPLLSEASKLLRVGRSGAAIRKARSAAPLIRDPVVRAVNLSAILIDAGAELKKSAYVREGVDALRAVEKDVTADLAPLFHYNLGNGYSYLGARERGFGAGTRPSLAIAASHLAAALEKDPRPDVRANLAGVLLAQGRWVEAYDEFNRVVLENPAHHNALARRGSCLMGIYNWTAGHRALLMSALADHEAAVKLSDDELVFQRSYRRVVHDLRRRGIEPRIPEVADATPDQKWIWENRLALNPCPLCEIESPEAFDLYPLAHRLEGGRRYPPVEELLDIVNAVCQVYAVARWSLFRALSDSVSETDHVISALGSPGAVHNLRVGLVMTALTGFYGVLGKIGYALNGYYRLGHPASKVTFQSIWLPPGSRSRSVPDSRCDLHAKLVRSPTSALSALHRVALSLEHGLGRYESLRTLRNQIEHHLVVATEGKSESAYYRAIKTAELESEAIRLGQIAKATIWYFGGALLRGEQERLKRAARQQGVVLRGEGDPVRRT